MTITRTKTVIQASASVAVSPAEVTSAWFPLTGNETSFLIKITNGATGPTIGCTCSIDLSPDNGVTIYPAAGGSFLAGTVNGGVYATQFDLLRSTMYARTRFGGNTAQAVTAQADAMTASGAP